MDKNEFRNLVEKYKKELLKMAGKSYEEFGSGVTVNAEEPERNPLDIDQGFEMAVQDPQTITPEVTYEEFLKQNPDIGFLKVQAFGAQMAVPISNISVVIKKHFLDMEKVFFEGVTDASGIIDNISLPAPPQNLSEGPNPSSLPFSVYSFSASHPFYSLEYPNFVQIFSGIKSIQPVKFNLSKTIK